MWLVAHGCSTAQGPSRDHFWRQTLEGKSQPIDVQHTTLLKKRHQAIPNYKIHWRKDIPSSLPHRARLNQMLDEAWADAKTSLPKNVLAGRFSVLLASTKGFSEDVVWDEFSTPPDALTPLLTDFLKRHDLKPQQVSVISSACASVAVALKVAEDWIQLDRTDSVLILACDSVGEFVVRGFHSLNALTPDTHARPFDEKRAGLQLGEAAAVLCVSRHKESQWQLTSKINCEGVAATRPDEKGQSLYLALEHVIANHKMPELILAHGTGTSINDATEDLVFSALYKNTTPVITACKWSVGHTLGVSCAIDIIAAIGCLETQTVFSLPFTSTVDKKMKGQYITGGTKNINASSALISSLGFGGVHSGVLLQKDNQ